MSVMPGLMPAPESMVDAETRPAPTLATATQAFNSPIMDGLAKVFPGL